MSKRRTNKKRTNSIRSKRRTTNKTKRIVSSVIGKTVKSRYIKTGGEVGNRTFSSKEEAETGIREVQYQGELEKELPSGKGVFTILNNNNTVKLINSENIKTKEINPDEENIIYKSIHFWGEGTITELTDESIKKEEDITNGPNNTELQKFYIIYFPHDKSITIITRPVSTIRKIARNLHLEEVYNKIKKNLKEGKIKNFEEYKKKINEQVKNGVSSSIFDV